MTLNAGTKLGPYRVLVLPAAAGWASGVLGEKMQSWRWEVS
jgi:drug/metabolite transporter (DMT)-like permease